MNPEKIQIRYSSVDVERLRTQQFRGYLCIAVSMGFSGPHTTSNACVHGTFCRRLPSHTSYCLAYILFSLHLNGTGEGEVVAKKCWFLHKQCYLVLPAILLRQQNSFRPSFPFPLVLYVQR